MKRIVLDTAFLEEEEETCDALQKMHFEYGFNDVYFVLLLLF